MVPHRPGHPKTTNRALFHHEQRDHLKQPWDVVGTHGDAVRTLESDELFPQPKHRSYLTLFDE